MVWLQVRQRGKNCPPGKVAGEAGKERRENREDRDPRNQEEYAGKGEEIGKQQNKNNEAGSRETGR